MRHGMGALGPQRAVDKEMIRHRLQLSPASSIQAFFVEPQMRVEGDLPNMPVRVGEIAVIAAREGRGWLLQDARTRQSALASISIDLVFACDILCNDDAAIAVPQHPRHCASSRCASRPHSASTTPARVKEAHARPDSAVFDFDEAEALIEAGGVGHIDDAERDESEYLLT